MRHRAACLGPVACGGGCTSWPERWRCEGVPPSGVTGNPKRRKACVAGRRGLPEGGAIVRQVKLVLPTLTGYRRSWLAADLAAGITLVAIAVPEQMATAHLAGMPAVSGLWAFVAGTLAFALLGRHPQLSVGADSTIAPVFAAGAALVAVQGSHRYGELVACLAIANGVVLLGAGLLRLGWLADFFPLPVVTGVLAGIGAEILVHQLPTVLGLPGGGTTTLGRLRTTLDQLGGINWWCAGIAAGVLAVVVAAEKLDRRAPGALAGVVGATALVATARLARHGVAVVGTVRAALPKVGLPNASWHDVGTLAATCATVAFLCVVQTSATVRSSGHEAAGGAGRQAFDRDLVAVGAGNLLSGLIGSFAVDASPPRTAVTVSAGGRSQATGLFALVAVGCVLSFATGLVADLPEAALGAILVFVSTRLFRVRQFREILGFSGTEFALAVLTFAVVVVAGTEEGVVVAALLALAQRVKASAAPRDAVLGREPGTDHWIPTDIGRPTEQVPGVVVYLAYAPLWYANASRVLERAEGAVMSAASPCRALVIDANAMSDIDYTGARALGELIASMQAAGVAVGLARASHLVHHDLEHSGILSRIGPEHLFASVDEAVLCLSSPSSPASAGGQVKLQARDAQGNVHQIRSPEG